MSWKHFLVGHELEVGGSGTAKVFGCRTKLAPGAGWSELEKVEPRALAPAVEATAVYLPITLELVLFIG